MPLSLILARIVHALVVVPVERIAGVGAGPGLLLQCAIVDQERAGTERRQRRMVCREGVANGRHYLTVSRVKNGRGAQLSRGNMSAFGDSCAHTG